MNRTMLLASAQKLQQPSDRATHEFEQKSELLASVMNATFSQRPDLIELIGERNLDMMRDNHKNHMRFFTSLFKSYDAEVLTETVLWVFRAYRSHGFQLSYWPAQLNGWVELLKKELSAETYAEVYPFYHWMIVNIPVFVKLSDASLADQGQHLQRQPAPCH